MRTAWVLQGLGFLILLGALYVLLQEKEPTRPEPIVTSSNQMPMNQHTLHVRSPAFNHEQSIPSKYTCDGENISPPIAFEEIPEDTVSLALIVEDPDVPTHIRDDGMWNHWVLFNIPPETTRIGEGESPQATQGITTSQTLEYQGPCPPDGMHRYYFKVFALDTILRLPEGTEKESVLEAMEGHILAEAELMGTYTRE